MTKTAVKKGQTLLFALIVMAVVSVIMAGIAGYLSYRINQRNKNALVEKEKVSLRTASLDVYQSLVQSSTDYATVSTNTTIEVTFSSASYTAFNNDSTTVSLTYQTGYFTYDLTGTYYKAVTKILTGTAISYDSLIYSKV
jgi:type II secretory pathway pseudopilin PulG